MAQYPDIAAGEDFTVELLRSMLPNFYRKTALTARASNTTAADDPDLIIPVVANGVYLIDFNIRVTALAAADIKTAWSFPSGTTGTRALNGPGSTALQANADDITSRWGVFNLGSVAAYNGVRDSATNPFWFREWAIVTVGSTAGNVGFQWAQNTSNATATSVLADSYGMSIRLA